MTRSGCEVKLGPCDSPTKVKRQNQSNARNAAYIILRVIPPSHLPGSVASTLSSSRSHSRERIFASEWISLGLLLIPECLWIGGGEPMSPVSSEYHEEALWERVDSKEVQHDDKLLSVSTTRSPRGRVRRRKGFKVWSDMEDHSSDFSSFSESEVERPSLEIKDLDDSSKLCIPAPDNDRWSISDFTVSGIVCADDDVGIGKVHEIYASELPQYSLDTDSTRSQDSVFEIVIEKVSPYRHLKDARDDCTLEDVLSKMQAEWWNVGVSVSVTYILSKIADHKLVQLVSLSA
jgi:hypothetical protein